MTNCCCHPRKGTHLQVIEPEKDDQRHGDAARSVLQTVIAVENKAFAVGCEVDSVYSPPFSAISLVSFRARNHMAYVEQGENRRRQPIGPLINRYTP